MAKRTTHRSTAGKKLYAVRDSEGKLKDIQNPKKAHGQDIKRKSTLETAVKKRRSDIERIARRYSDTMKRLAKS